MMMAANVGVIRHLQFIKRNARPMYGLDVPTDWKLQIEGAMSEYALAKYLNVHWEGVGFPDADDVGNEDVRVTPHENGCLILHDRDKDDKKYWLLVGQNGEYEIKQHDKRILLSVIYANNKSEIIDLTLSNKIRITQYDYSVVFMIKINNEPRRLICQIVKGLDLVIT